MSWRCWHMWPQHQQCRLLPMLWLGLWLGFGLGPPHGCPAISMTRWALTLMEIMVIFEKKILTCILTYCYVENALHKTCLQLRKVACTCTTMFPNMKEKTKLKIRYPEINVVANESIIEDSPTYLPWLFLLHWHQHSLHPNTLWKQRAHPRPATVQ